MNYSLTFHICIMLCIQHMAVNLLHWQMHMFQRCIRNVLLLLRPLFFVRSFEFFSIYFLVAFSKVVETM